MDNEPTDPPAVVISDPQAGAMYTPLYVERRVRTYAIQENELRTIATLNTQSTVWFSIGSSVTTFSLGCCWDLFTLYLTGGKVPVAGCGLAAVTALIGLGSLATAVYFVWSKNTELQNILNDN